MITEINQNDDDALCKCLHQQAQHNAEGCTIPGCGCKKFDFLAEARRLEVPILQEQPWKATMPRGFFARWIRRWIGLNDDVAKGELFEKLVVSNFVHQANLLNGLRTDFDTTNNTQNPVNSKVVDLEERLTFYENHNDSLHSTYRKLMRIRTEQQIAREREQDAAQRKAVVKELKDHAQFGELIDCKTCGKNVDGPDPKCPECSGLGVVPNPDYIPTPEEIHGSDSQEASGGNGAGPQLVR